MISINFAHKNYRFMAWLHAGLVTGSVIFMVTAAVIVWSALSLRADIALMDNRLKEMSTAEEKLRPLLAERDRVIKDLTSMSALMESRRFSWTRLLTNIESVFPVGAAVARVDFNPRDRVLTLDGVAQSPEALRNLIVGMERSAWFKDPYLKHQLVDKGSIFFNVVASYQEHKAADMVQGK